LCSGKVYYDLLAGWKKAGPRPLDLGVARVEELYPFPSTEIRELLGDYPNLEEVVWLQEEPRNMGAWPYVAPRLRDVLGSRMPLRYVGRTRRASPAEGSQGWHVREQGWLIEAASTLDKELPEEGIGGEVQHGG
jgi:2-oxoglutarate dehydrogenase E1 component